MDDIMASLPLHVRKKLDALRSFERETDSLAGSNLKFVPQLSRAPVPLSQRS